MNKEQAYLNGFIKAAMSAQMAPLGAPNVPQFGAGPAGQQPQPQAQQQAPQQGITPMQQPAPQTGALPQFMQLMKQYAQQSGGQHPAPRPVQSMHIHQPS